MSATLKQAMLAFMHFLTGSLSVVDVLYVTL